MSDIKRLEKQLKRERSFISIIIIILAIVNKIMPDSSISSDTIIIKHKQ
jgi:hypothetical protein